MDLTLTEEKTVAWMFEVTFEVRISVHMHTCITEVFVILLL